MCMGVCVHVDVGGCVCGWVYVCMWMWVVVHVYGCMCACVCGWVFHVALMCAHQKLGHGTW